MKASDMERFLEMSARLDNEQDREDLLSHILDTAMDIANCDAGTLYLLEDTGLRFCRMVTRSQGVRQGGHAGPITLAPVPLEEKYVCAQAAMHNELINVPDIRHDTRFDFSGSLKYDAMTGYRTVSMLVVPMRSDRGEVIGVTQLINAQDADGTIIPFDPGMNLLIDAIASQAAISITNMIYNDQITRLLDSLVGSLSAAIDERSHYNANHTRNMVRYAEAFLDWLSQSGNAWKFDEDKRRSFLMSVWLHDVGKLVVPLEVMDKATRLGPNLERMEQRLRTIDLLDRIAALEGRITQEELAERNAQRKAADELIHRINKAGFLPEADQAAVEELARRTYTDETGEKCLWVTPEEYHCLSIRRGTLTEEERNVMQSHASVTSRILSHVYFPKSYAQVPRWASSHHELLNGRGYPNHLTEDDIPREVRLLTILDVFEALTARDRPYKPPMPLEKALSILHNMVDEGGVDGEVLRLFEESRAWEVGPYPGP